MVPRWIVLIYEYIIDKLQKKELIYSPKKANDAIKWIERHCFHTEGPLAPGPFKLELWQKAIVASIYGLCDPETGYRQFREILLLIARKNGKSIFASSLARYEWTHGGFGTRIYTIAPKLDQAEIIYNNIWTMTQLDPDYQEKKRNNDERDEHKRRVNEEDLTMEKHRMTDLFIPATNSTVKKIAFSARKSDGFNPSLCICDEIASWSGDAGLKQYEVMKSGMGARPEGMLISCTTSGYVNDSIYDELLKRATRFLMGDSKEKKLLPFLYMIEDLEKWNDINELRKSNPNLGVSVSIDYMLEEIAIAEGSLSKKAEFLTKYCNIKQNSSLAWLPSNVVTDACGPQLRLEDFRGCYCVGGIDLSQTRDLTSCCVVIQRGGELYVFSQFFLPGEKIDEATERDGIPYQLYIQRGLLTPSGTNFIDYQDCYNWFRNLVETYEILPLQIGYDRYCAQYLVKDLVGYGFHCDDVWQGENLYGVLMETQGLLEDKKIHIGDNDLLKAHLLNSAIKMSTERNRGKLVKVHPALHIDGCAALIDAMTVRQKWWNETSAQLMNEE